MTMTVTATGTTKANLPVMSSFSPLLFSSVSLVLSFSFFFLSVSHFESVSYLNLSDPFVKSPKNLLITYSHSSFLLPLKILKDYGSQNIREKVLKKTQLRNTQKRWSTAARVVSYTLRDTERSLL